MKRIKFLSGISAMCAFAVIALAGSLMTSCEKDDFDATFKTKPAEAIINVTVKDTKGNAVSGATISASAGTVSGMTVTLTGNSTDGSLSAQSVTVTVTAPANYTINETSQVVPISALNAGDHATYNISFLAIGDIVWDDAVVEDTPIVYELLSPAHDQAGAAECWAENANDRQVEIALPYTQIRYVEIVSNTITNAEALEDVDGILALYGGVRDEQSAETYKFDVPAWSKYRAWYTVKPKTITWTATKEGERISGELVIKTIIDDELKNQNEEIPGHDHTHGHADTTHGSDNAGGGEGAAD